MPTTPKLVLVLCYDECEFREVRRSLPTRKCTRVYRNRDLQGINSCTILILPRGVERFRKAGGDWYEAISCAARRGFKLCIVQEERLKDPFFNEWLEAEERNTAVSHDIEGWRKHA